MQYDLLYRTRVISGALYLSLHCTVFLLKQQSPSLGYFSIRHSDRQEMTMSHKDCHQHVLQRLPSRFTGERRRDLN